MMDGPAGARASGHPLQSLGAVADLPRADIGRGASTGLGLIVRDLARALGAEIALLVVPDLARENVEVLAAWGPAASVDGLPSTPLADGFVGRALGFERAAVEPIDANDSILGTTEPTSRARHAAGAPVRPHDGPAGVLCAAFPPNPSRDVAKTLWLAESYAQLAALFLQDPDALEGLLSSGHLDGLTGCLTQADFLHELAREIARSDRHGRSLSLAFIDLDRFKRVNDRYGHLHGSRVLANIATILRTEIRREDTIGRYGGDEFVLILPDTDETAAVELAQRLRSTITTTMINLPHDPIDASIGIAQWQPGSPGADLLAYADEALLAAKSAGGAAVIAASTLNRADALGSSPPRPSTPHTSKTSESPKTVLMRDVLEVLAQFDQSGGASIELIAWELNSSSALVAKSWSQAIREGLITRAGTDPGTGEQMWRLSDHGRGD
jgi:diguanylate cyclase (GGDEF)-like protein